MNGTWPNGHAKKARCRRYYCRHRRMQPQPIKRQYCKDILRTPYNFWMDTDEKGPMFYYDSDAGEDEFEHEQRMKEIERKTTHMFSLIGYCLCSAILLLVNKMAITHFESPSLLLVCQFTAAVVFVKILNAFGVIHLETIDPFKLKSFVGVAILFSLSIFANVKALRNANVETVIVFRACTPLAVAVVDWLLLNRALPTVRSFISLFAIMFGAVCYVLSDEGFEATAYTWVLLYFCAIVAEMVHAKHVLETINMSTWSLVYYNNLLAIPTVLVLGFWFGEHDVVMNHEWDHRAVLTVVYSCVVGIGMSYAGFSLRQLVSATTFTVVGVSNKFFTVLVNMAVWHRHAHFTGLASLVLCIAGAMSYDSSVKQDPRRKKLY